MVATQVGAFLFMAKEIWKPITEFEGYEVSNLGRVRSYFKHCGKNWNISNYPQRILKPGISPDGYLYVCLRKNNKSKIKRIHQLVLLSFIGEKPEGMEVCHNDGDPSNNNLNNLRYDTPSGNIQDIVIHNRRNFSIEDVTFIRRKMKSGTDIEELAKMFKVSRDTIYSAGTGRSYKICSEKPSLPPHKQSIENIRKIRREYMLGKTLAEIAKTYNITISGVSRIVNGNRCIKAGGPIKGIDY